MHTSLHKALCAIALASACVAAFAEEGVSKDTILIGQTIGVTGTIAGPVKEMVEGANAYFKSVNLDGGIFGRKIKLITLDDKFDPALSAENARKLIVDEHVFALFQSRGTPHTKAMLPILEKYRIPLIAPATGAAIFHDPVNPLVFNVRPRYQLEVSKGIEFFALSGYKKIGFLYVDDSFGNDALIGFKNGMKTYHLDPTVITNFARVKPDNAAVAETILKANPAALIIASSEKNTVDVIKEIHARGGKMVIMTLSNNSSDAFINDLGKDGPGVMLSQITPAPELLSSELGQEFRTAAKISKVTYSYAAMEGFVSAKVLVEGLRKAGPNLTRSQFIRALESIRREDLGGISLTYSPENHSGSEFVELTMIGKKRAYVR
jgi:ABC-type branched-subunit amino acid transport system substrate-binding protein